MKRALLLLALSSLAMFAFIFGNEGDEIKVLDFAILSVAMCLVLLAQSAALLLVNRKLSSKSDGDRRPLGVHVLGAAFAASNAYAFALTTVSAPLVVQAALALGWGTLVFVLMRVQRFQPFALFMMSAYSIMSFGLYAYTQVRMAFDTYTATDVPPIRSQRNVYLIGNESLPSPRAYRQLYDISSLPHVEFLRKSGFRVLDRSYSADVQTLPSFSRMLEFSRPVDERDIRRRLVFKSLNSTFSAFRRSGYKVQFIYRNGYFGMDSHVVDYVHPRGAYFQCGFVPTAFFYGLCSNPIQGRINWYLFGKPPRLDRELVVNRIRAAAQSESPWLTIHHISHPFHSKLSHSFRNRRGIAAFRNRVRGAADQIQHKMLEKVVRAIQEHDSAAVIVLFGDHGAAMLRGADLDDPPAPVTVSDILEDRFGVMIAVYPRDFCSNRVSEGSTTTYIVESIIKCLNGNDRPTPREAARARTFYWEDEPRDAARYANDRQPASGRATSASRQAPATAAEAAP